MRRVLTIVVGLSLVVLGQGLTAQQGRGGGGGGGGNPSAPESIPATATYSDSAPEHVGGFASAVRIADYLGEIGELQFTLVGEGGVQFFCPAITKEDVSLPEFPGCEDPDTQLTDWYTLTVAGLRHMPLLTVGPNADCPDSEFNCGQDGFGKQHNLEWKIGKQKYWLQWVRDAGTSPPNYVRVECRTARTGTDTRCIEADMDTKVGVYDSTIDTGTMSGRETGAWARLWRGQKFVGL